MITIDDVKKVEIRAGKILEATSIEGSEKLLKLTVDFGLKPLSGSPDQNKSSVFGLKPLSGSPDQNESSVLGLKPLSGSPDQNKSSGLELKPGDGLKDIRTILSGIAKYFPGGEGLAGITCGFVANLEPRPMMGMESQGMILAVSGEGYFSLLKLDDAVPPGSLVK